MTVEIIAIPDVVFKISGLACDPTANTLSFGTY